MASDASPTARTWGGRPRTLATRIVASILVPLLGVSCGTVKETAQRDAVERVFIPRGPRAVASPVVDELELRRALEELLPHVDVAAAPAGLRRMLAEPRFHGRQPDELRVVLASWGSGPVALEEIGRGYRAFCAATRRTDCLEGPLTDSSVYRIAFDFAVGSQWEGFTAEMKSTIDPSTIRIVLLTGMVIFMATIAIPELTSKIPAAIATAVLTAYLGARAVCDLVFGWIQMVRGLDAATTFEQVRAAGQRYGLLVGAQTARILVLLATAAIAQGGLIARLMKLPRSTQASAALAAETGGGGLEAVGAIKEARVLPSGVAITVEGAAKGALSAAMAARDAPPSMSPGTQQGSHPPAAPDRNRVKFTRPQLQHAFKHAGDFGVSGNPNNSTLDALQSAIEKHVTAPGTRAISGEYRGLKGVTHFVDPNTGLNVIRDAEGTFLSGWKLSAQQLHHLLTTGKLGGG